MMKAKLVALAVAMLVSGAVFAQSANTATNDSTSAASNSGVTNSTVLNTYSSPYSKNDTDFRTNQASTAPAVIGSVSGCTYITGTSGSIVVANFGNSTAGEAPGCLINNFVSFVANGVLKKEKDQYGVLQWTGPSKMILSGWCQIPIYAKTLEESGEYICGKTVSPSLQATALAKPAQYSDPYVRARMGLPPLK